MKPAFTILSHIGSLPSFAKLKQHNCYRKYIKLLPPKHQKAIAFVYIREKVLYIALKHPGFKMEFGYQKETFLSVARSFAKTCEGCEAFALEKVLFFHSKFYPTAEEGNAEETVPTYHELATANFAIKSDDADIQEKFKAIKQAIATNRCKQ